VLLFGRQGPHVTEQFSPDSDEHPRRLPAASPSADGGRRFSRLGRAAAAAAAVAAIIWGVWRVAPFGGDALEKPPGDEARCDDQTPMVSGPAYSAEATVADLKQASMEVAAELIAAYPDAADALNVMAQLQFHLGNTPEAIRSWRRCLEADPKCGDAHYGLGYIAHLEGENAEAAERFRAALAIRPDDARIPVLLADALTRLGKPGEAVPLLVEHLKSGKGSLDALVCLGRIHMEMQEYDKARRVFEEAVRIDPACREAQFGLGNAWARLGEAEKSRQAMSKFQALVANRRAESAVRVMAFDDLAKGREVAVLIHGEAAKVHAAHGNLEKAEELWRKTAALDPKHVPSRMELLAIYERSGRNRAALRVCEELRDLEPQRADHWLNLGVLYSRLGQRDDALAALDRAIDLEPDNPRYRQARELIRSTP